TGIAPSAGCRGDSYDNALAETIIGLFKTEVIRRKGPWKILEAVEFATLGWVDWFIESPRLPTAAVRRRPAGRSDRCSASRRAASIGATMSCSDGETAPLLFPNHH